jgi:hypothetical protein
MQVPQACRVTRDANGASEIAQDNHSIVYVAMTFQLKGKSVLVAEFGGKQFDAKKKRGCCTTRKPAENDEMEVPLSPAPPKGVV